MKNNIWFKTTVLLFILIAFISTFFFITIKGQSYLGIRVEKEQNEWVIKKIQNGGVASHTDLKKGDRLIAIDSKTPDTNDTLNQWLIIENASQIEISRNSQHRIIMFSNKDNISGKQLIFTLIALVFLSILFILPTFVSSSLTYRLFYLFVVTLSLSLISVIPSSMGIDLARIIIISVITLFPLFFLKFSSYGKINTDKSKIFVSIINFFCMINFFIMIINYTFHLQNYWLSEYLAVGIFYVFGISLIILSASNLILTSKTDKNTILTQVNLPLITILSFVPLFFFYILPNNHNAPFYLVILFILLPLAAIIHLLLINRLIKYNTKMRPLLLSGFMAGSAGIIISLLIELGKYIPNIYLTIFTATLIYALLPLLSESFSLLNKKQNDIGSGIQLFLAVEEERENISLYIHDTIIQDVIFEMNKFENKKTITSHEMKMVFDEIIYGLRELCTEIYPLMIQEIGLKNTLKTTINAIQRKYPVIIDIDVDSEIELLSLKVKNFLLRTIRERITNSIKHGKASKIKISLTSIENKFTLTVIDNGFFVDSPKTTDNHFGIHLIQKKIKMIGGMALLTYDSGKTKFQLELPKHLKDESEVTQH